MFFSRTLTASLGQLRINLTVYPKPCSSPPVLVSGQGPPGTHASQLGIVTSNRLSPSNEMLLLVHPAKAQSMPVSWPLAHPLLVMPHKMYRANLVCPVGDPPLCPHRLISKATGFCLTTTLCLLVQLHPFLASRMQLPHPHRSCSCAEGSPAMYLGFHVLRQERGWRNRVWGRL